MASTEVELHGHIIDSYILPRVWSAIMDAGAHYRVRELRVGQSETETSYARLEVTAATQEALDELVGEPDALIPHRRPHIAAEDCGHTHPQGPELQPQGGRQSVHAQL